MPPKAVKTIQDLIFWQYAKIISESAGYGKRQFGFVMDRFKKLSSGEINWSTSIREYVKEREKKDICIYCGKKEDLTLEHILPRSRGGPDTTDNVVFAYKNCNSSKDGKRLYERFELENRYKLPRIERFGVLTDEDIEKVEKGIGTETILTVGRVPFSGRDMNRFEKGKSIVGRIQKRRVEDIIDEVGTLLHEALAKERGES